MAQTISRKLDIRSDKLRNYNLDGRGEYDYGYSKRTSLEESLTKIYETKLNIPQQFYTKPQTVLLITRIINSVPLSHRNLDYIAAAAVLVDKLRLTNNVLSNIVFDAYFIRYCSGLYSLKEKPKKEDIAEIIVKSKADFLRYVRYVQKYLK